MTVATERRTAWDRVLGSWAMRAALLLALAVVARAVGYLPAVINPDENVFALAAREVLAGHLPYVTLFDNKPVGSTLLIATMGGALGDGLLPVRLLGTLAVWVSAMLVDTIGRRGGLSSGQSLFAAALYVAFASTMGGLATMTEILATPFTAAAVLLLQQLPHAAALARATVLVALAGLAAGAAILVKLVPAVPCALVGGLVLLRVLRRDGAARAIPLGAVYAIAAAAPMLIVAAVYAGAGLLDTFLYSNIGFASRYAARGPGIATVASRLATVVIDTWPLLILVAAGIGAAVWAWRETLRDALLPLVFAWLLGELLSASASGFFYAHYFLGALAPAALLAVTGTRAIARWVTDQPVGQSRVLAIVGIAAVLIPVAAVQTDTLRTLRDGDTARTLARQIRKASGDKPSSLLVTTYGMTALYDLTHAPLPPTRYAVPPHLFSPQSRMVQDDPVVEIRRILASRPRFIVTGGDEKPPRAAAGLLSETLERNYRSIATHGKVTLFQSIDRDPQFRTGS